MRELGMTDRQSIGRVSGVRHSVILIRTHSGVSTSVVDSTRRFTALGAATAYDLKHVNWPYHPCHYGSNHCL